MTIGWFQVLLTVCVSNLMTTSLDPPAANGTTTCTGRSGNDVAISGAGCWDQDGDGHEAARRPPKAAVNISRPFMCHLFAIPKEI